MSVLDVIGQLGKLSGFRDREPMEAYLVKALLEVTPSYLNSLYMVRSVSPEPDIHLLARAQQDGIEASDADGSHLPPELIRAMGDAVVTGEGQCLKKTREQPVSTYVVPVNNDLNESVVLVQQSVNPSSQQLPLIEGVLKVYSNFLELFYDHATDPLTGLLNRATLNKHLQKLVAKQSMPRHKRRKDRAQHWLGVLDIDHFKQINDRFGHLYGDEILILVSRLMVESFREEDLCFRYGGEEFIVMLEVDSADNALTAFERFRERVANYLFPQVGNVTVSIGIVEVAGHTDVTKVIGDADKALYFSKANGRNQCHSFEVLVASGDVVDERFETQEVDFF